MARGNMFIGQGSGKVGNLVVSTRAGEQITRVYQPRVANPKSDLQMLQRARFANAVKFYKKAVQNFFQFAYEDKKKKESYYNAFMRHNVSLSVLLTKANVDSPYFPALGRWVMSQGSLSSAFTFSSADNTLKFSNAAIKANDTIGAISSALIGQGFHAGDIVTFVLITSAINNLAGNSNVQQQPSWLIAQFVVDTSNTNALSSANFIGSRADGMASYEGNSLVVENGSIKWNGALSNYMAATCCIITRKGASGVLASNATLSGNSVFDSMINATYTLDYKDSVLVSWGAQQGAILQGAIANTDVTMTVQAITVNGEKPPLAVSDKFGVVTYTVQGAPGSLTDVAPEGVPAGVTVVSHSLSADASTYTLKLNFASEYAAGTVTYMGYDILKIADNSGSGA